MRTLLTTLFIMVAVAAVAQDDSTRYVFGLPVSDDDTTQNFPQRDLAPADHLEPLAAAEIPEQVLNALETEDQYRGWRDSTIYLDKNTGLYLVPVINDEGVKTFGLNERGQPRTFSEVRRTAK